MPAGIRKFITRSWSLKVASLFIVVVPTSGTKHKILCAREIQRSINESVHALLVEQIESLGLGHFYTVTKTSIIGKNGTEFIFAGLRTNISNIKSIPGITRAWIEEAQTVSNSSMKVLIPTVRENGSEIWLSFNPELEDDDVYQNFVVSPPTDAIVVKIGWQDNPWFPEVLRQEKDDLYKRNPAEAAHVWGGKCKQAIDGAIFAEELRIAAEEQRLGLEIWKFLAPRGSMRELARELDVSPQYVCDIAHGRRKISEAVVEKVMAL